MGKNKLRRLISSETKWTDKNASKHQHEFSERYLLCIENSEGRFSYYEIIKCKKCNSFRCVSRPGAVNGCILESELEKYKDLPRLEAFRSHKWTIGFNDLKIK